MNNEIEVGADDPANPFKPIEADKDDVANPFHPKTRASVEAIAAGPPPSLAADVAKSAGTGLVKGTFGIPGSVGDIVDLLKRAGNWVNQKQVDLGFAKPEDIERFNANRGGAYNPATGTIRDTTQTPITTQSLLDRTGIADQLYQPQTGLGKAAERVAEFLPGAAAPGLVAGKTARALGGDVVKFGAVPGAVSEAAGQATDYVAPGYGDAARLVTGLLAPAAISGVPTSARRAENAASASKAGIPVTAGEQTGNEALRYLEDKLGVGNRAEQLGAFTNWATGLIGKGEHATPELHQGTFDKILEDVGDRFDASQRNLTLQHDQPLENELLAQSHDITTPGNHNVEATSAFDDFFGRYSNLEKHYGGNIPGWEYQKLRSDIARRARNAGENNDLAETLHGLNNSLDSAAERSIAAAGGDPTQFARNRADYRKVLTIEGALKRGNEETRNGIIPPAALENAAKQVYGTRPYLRGDTPFELVPTALAGLAPNLPNSGTEPRMWARHLLAGLGGAAGLALSGGGEHGVHGLLLGEQYAPVAAAAAGYGIAKPALHVAQPFLRGDLNPKGSHDVRTLQGLLAAVPGLLSTQRDREPLRVTVHPAAPPGLLSQ